jgi:hypothetical protein
MVHRTVPSSSPSRNGYLPCSGGSIARPAASELWREPARNLFWACDLRRQTLRGESPGNLPVVQPTKFELAVNLKTARILGIDLDTSSILFRANKVIE